MEASLQIFLFACVCGWCTMTDCSIQDERCLFTEQVCLREARGVCVFR